MAWRLWLPRLSMTTMSPGASVGSRICSKQARKLNPLIWSIDDAGRFHAVAAQRGQEGQRAPAPVPHLGHQAPAAQRAPMAAGHVGLGPGLVDEHQATGIKPVLILLPPLPPAGHVGAILLGGEQAFF